MTQSGSGDPFGRMRLAASLGSTGQVRPILVLVGLAILLGLLDAVQMRAQWALTGYPGGISLALLAAVPPWLGVVILAPGVWYLARTFRVDRVPRTRSLAIHAGASVAFAVLHVGIQASNAVTLGRYQDGFLSAVGHLVGFYFLTRIITYWALSAGMHAVLFYREVRAREVAESRLEARLQEARLDALRGQLNPHFLFNALNGLSALALRGDREAVVDGLSQVSDMLRVTLDGSLPQEIPLQQELWLTDRFLELQRLRFGERLTVHRDIAPETVDALLPSLVLQPLVENALDHGIARVPGRGVVTIRTARENGRLRIEVTDTGPGFRASAAEAPGVVGSRKGIGLGNTRERIAQLYGSDAALMTGTVPGGGALVTLLLPYRT